jgi:5-formyltetrahydrofolate cyclo-ligase
MTTKTELRKAYKQKRRLLESGTRLHLSYKVVKNALFYLANKPQIQHIHVFLPIKRLYEIDIFPLINTLVQEDKNVYTSISDHDSQEMATVKLTMNQNFIEDKYGIPVPVEWQNGDDTLMQLIFIPLLAYDLKGHRLGYGKGFYDRFLSKFPPTVVKAGLSLFSPENEIPIEPHDIPLDICISPDGIRSFSI